MGRPKMFDGEKKWCPRCSSWKLYSEFWKCSGSPSGLDNYCQNCVKIRHRQLNYGITPEKYKEMYEEQNGKCAIPSCDRPIEVIDHCHLTNVVRRLLCKQCNLAIGNFRDNPQLMRDAADYVESFKEI